MTGTISILSVGAGDTTLSFDSSDPEERNRAKRIVQDMLKRGYAILIPVGEQNGEKIYRRAKAFDPDTCEYVIAGVPEPEGIRHGKKTRAEGKAKSGEAKPAAKGSGGGRRQRRVKAADVEAVAVGRTAGG